MGSKNIFRVRTEVLTEKAYEGLCELIMVREIQPGQKLPEVALAKRLGTSRTPLRLALERLESEGLVYRIPDTGAFVREISPDEFRQLHFLRKLLECMAVGLAASRITDEQIDQLRLINNQFKTVMFEVHKKKLSQLIFKHNKLLIETEAQFHGFIIDAAGNEYVSKIWRQLHFISHLVPPQIRLTSSSMLFRDLTAGYMGHRRVIRALRKRDVVQAVSHMDAHFGPSENAPPLADQINDVHTDLMKVLYNPIRQMAATMQGLDRHALPKRILSKQNGATEHRWQSERRKIVAI